ncbi:PREDICTED: tRNA dimethylallyltransferase 2 isoform X2 [Nicotiana attenuata]|uniref:tRNA dimethylallyltransferase 2 isoform X2 n=1 Tax=Nicotiana attenuata TaxID=49451 RepID=UPI000904E8AC|nr:PREDICTED: tRNA dimethylallyltransferase 2 isoform X2 [Nicotiana attenuata]
MSQSVSFYYYTFPPPGSCQQNSNQKSSAAMEVGEEHEDKMQNPNNGAKVAEINLNHTSNSKPKVVVIMGATGSGKSKLAIDLASYFPIEIINADSMQVYSGLDVLTNKVTSQEQKGVPHHLLGTINPSVEFTAKDFRDSVFPIISDIWSRNRLPVIVGGTNYYIQALVSPFLLDDSVEDPESNCLSDSQDEQPDLEVEFMGEDYDCAYNHLKDIDPVAANRIHPNNDRKINQYLNLYERFGVIPSKLLQERTVENWGQVDNSRYDFCFLCVNASLSTMDPFVNKRVDHMVDAGLLKEVFDIYTLDADYTKGLRQAIGVREFEPFLRLYILEHQKPCDESYVQTLKDQTLELNIQHIMDSSDNNEQKAILTEAIENVKLNTRRLVRRQRRRLNRLQMLFGWNIHYVDATKSIISGSDDLWAVEVVKPSAGIIKSFLTGESSTENGSNASEELKLMQKDLWTQYVCEPCGNKVLRGEHEWEQHRQGRHHRKRVSRLKKTGSLCS